MQDCLYVKIDQDLFYDTNLCSGCMLIEQCLSNPITTLRSASLTPTPSPPDETANINVCVIYFLDL